MEKIYNPNQFENNIQNFWEKNKTFHVIENKKKKKYYCLAMLPYPSGKLHMGHVRNYTISDVIARFHRMQGKNVLHPIGWDAFGLPAEEAALNNNILPKKWTENNIQYMKQQLKKLGFSYDWDREITTCHPKYYKWEQWLFNKLYSKKLIYKKTSLIHWCPIDKTVLANEQVINNKCWRCQSKVIVKVKPQWFLKTETYAEKLLNDLNLLNKWPKKIKTMQKNWIGQSHGFEIIFDILNQKKKIKIYLHKLYLIMNINFISISPWHSLSKAILTKKEIKQFINNIYITKNNFPNYSEFQYLGKNTSQYAIHPITKIKIPIWITNYTELEYNTNIRASIPKKNMYDLFFSKKYNINTTNHNIKNNLFFLKKLNKIDFSEKIFQYLKKKKNIKKITKYRLQDWSISRQRYWGTPIPIVYFKNKKITTIPNNQLPVILPSIKTMNDFQDIKKNQKNWSKINLYNHECIRETDTFDTFIESSWYYIRYTAPYFTGMLDKKSANYWLPIDQYIGGIEHATMHLIYFRLFHKILYDLKLVKNREPAKKLLCQGMVLSDAYYYINEAGKKSWISSKNINIIKNKKGKIKKIISKNKKKIIYAGMIKMSKSKNNGIDPQYMINKYGADTIRLFIMFAAPVTADIEWNESGVKGMFRFLQKIWNLVYNYKNNINNITIKKIYNIQKIQHYLNETILKVSKNIEKRQSFNTAISEIIKFTNYIQNIFPLEYKNKKNMKYILNTIIKMLYPFTPHISFFLWNILNKHSNIDNELWPKYNKDHITRDTFNLIVQINGKKKEIITLYCNNTQEEILNILKTKSKISNVFKKHTIKKIIYIKKKLINIVI